MGKIVISHQNLTPWPVRIFTKTNFTYTNQFLSVIQEPTQLARKICEKKLKSPHPTVPPPKNTKMVNTPPKNHEN